MLPSQVAGTMRVLQPQFAARLSPAIGLASVHASLAHNLAEHPRTAPESQLVSELFLQAGGKLRATRTQSKPGTHLDASAWGSTIGLALSRAGPTEVKALLKGQHGIATRRGNQSNPPPRFARLIAPLLWLLALLL